ncbi:MAG: hypothetical protein EOP59_06985, partial [Sphingomonadales bacterium]
MIDRMKALAAGTSALAFALCAAQPALAQDAPAAEPATQDTAAAEQESEGLEEIVVTAERRESRLQETPITISAFSERALETRGINNLQNLTNFAPNVEISATKRPAGGSTAISAFIRGVGTGDFQIPTDPAIGLYVESLKHPQRFLAAAARAHAARKPIVVLKLGRSAMSAV